MIYRFGTAAWQILGLLLALVLTTSVCGRGADNLASKLQPLIENHQGKVAVAVKHLPSGESFTHRADEPMPTASLIKFPLMIAAYDQVEQGRLDLDHMITLRESDKVPGSGILTPHFSPGMQVSLRDAIHLMIVYSDNTATNLVIDQVGLPATATLMEEKYNCPHTKLHSQVFRRDTSIFPERSQQFGLGSTTAGEQVRLYEQLWKKQLVSAEACDEMLQHLHACDDHVKIGRKLPDDVKFAHKTGSVSASRTDAGIIESPHGPIAVCVLTTDNQDRRWADDNAAEVLCSDIGLAVYRHFNPSPTADVLPTGILKIGATGALVESLQRTLNARLEPSPQLAVDGDFGPATQAAVLRFQASRGLPASGEVDEAMWQALGTLITEDEPVPAPEVVNAQPWDKAPREPLDGPPIVTCQAWAIADGQTGSLLWGHNEHEPRPPASMTKIMTGYVVAKLAATSPEILKERITFSRRADDTIGSTAGVRCGESLTVRELLYGLLLPSGNDASVALAEHFGHRAHPHDNSVTDDKTDPYVDFVAAMNATASTLGMEHSQFRNTHGLTEAGHECSPRDVLTLVHAAMQIPLLRQIVSTPQHGCQLEGPGGYRRNVRWPNTNRLLAIEGFDGIKTGTTSAAGACLVSRGAHDDHQLLVVVMGATSTDSRYADSRNLYRWAWRQLESQEQ